MAIGDAQAMAATTTAAAVFQAAEAQLLRDAFKSESQESEEERAHKLASAREQKLKQVLWHIIRCIFCCIVFWPIMTF